MEKTAKTERSATAIRYLKAAARQIETYGEDAEIEMLIAELFCAAVYREGNIMEIAERLSDTSDRLAKQV